LKINANLAGEQEMTLVFAKTTFPLNQQGIGGSLGGLYDMEYGALRPAQQDLHDMASAVATMINDALAGGFDLNGNPGQPLFSYNAGSTSGMLAVNALGASELAL
ncbi:MAG TPA: flagellar hook-associated protein FlgK, partial [Pseudomonas sp.]|nr:flagellar hook-associated protein FlgK [Pseudomonas sp.]